MVIAQESKKMLNIPGFSVQETSELSGVTVPRLHYLNRSKQIVPTKASSSKRATVLYSWCQIIELKMLDILKESNVNDMVVGKILSRINSEYEDLVFLNLDFIVYDDAVYWFNRKMVRKDVISAIETKIKNPKPNIASINIWTPAPYPSHKEYQTFELKWNPYHSLRYVILSIVLNAKNSTNIDFEEFKQKVNYDSFKDALELE